MPAGRNGDTFRFDTDVDHRYDLARADVDDAEGVILFVGGIKEASVRRQRNLLGIGHVLDHSDNLAG